MVATQRRFHGANSTRQILRKLSGKASLREGTETGLLLAARRPAGLLGGFLISHVDVFLCAATSATRAESSRYPTVSSGQANHQVTGSATRPCDSEWNPAVMVDASAHSCMAGNRGIICEKTIFSSMRASAAPTQ